MQPAARWGGGGAKERPAGRMWRLAAAAALLGHAAAAELRAMSMFRDGMVYAAPPPEAATPHF